MPSSSQSLTLGGKIVAGSGVLFLIASFLPWYSWSFKGLGMSQSGSASAWDVTLPKLAALLVILAVAEVIAVQVVNVKLPQSVSGLWPLGRLGVAGLAALFVVIELLKGQDLNIPDTSALESLSGLGGGTDLGVDYSFGRGFGMFLGTLLVIALVAGNVLRLKETPETATPGATGGQSGAWGQNQAQGQNPQNQNQWGQNQGQNQNQGQFGEQPPYGQPDQGQYNPNQQGQYGQPSQGQYGQEPQNPYGQQDRPGQSGQQYPPQQGGSY